VRGYNIYRSEQAGAFPDRPLNTDPVAEPRYVDGGLANDRTYFYVVRAVVNEAPPWQESASSNMAAATPRDITPPAAPLNLRAAATRAEVSLIWDANTEADLAGYLVYRSEVPQTAYRRVTPQPLRATTYADRTVARGTTYYYVITAVDTAATPNESLFSDELIVHVP
jgi:fibronectin type 3 domain-containing protein